MDGKGDFQLCACPLSSFQSAYFKQYHKVVNDDTIPMTILNASVRFDSVLQRKYLTSTYVTAFSFRAHTPTLVSLIEKGIGGRSLLPNPRIG